MRVLPLSAFTIGVILTGASQPVLAGGESQTPDSRAVGVPIYRVTGVMDSGDNDDNGTKTAIHCTNPGGSGVKLQFVTRKNDGTLVHSLVVNVGGGDTITYSTGPTVLFDEGNNYGPNAGSWQGHAIVRSTGRAVFCTAMVLDAGSTLPSGFALHMVRMNPKSGYTE